MAEYEDREHFIPIRKSELVDYCLKEPGMNFDDRDKFRQFCRLLEATFHFEYHSQLEELKSAYAPFDPDADTQTLSPLSDEQKEKKLEQLFSKFQWLLVRANYRQLTNEEIQAALEGSSDWGINMDVDFNVFERYHIFVRGDTMVKRGRRIWWKFFRLQEKELPTFQRLVLMLKLRKHKRLSKNIDTKSVFLKVFKDIPKMDLEMILPGARPQMTKLDKALIWYPLLLGLGLFAYNILDNFVRGSEAALLSTAVTLSLAGLLGGYGYKSYYSYNVKKQSYSLKLTESLYYQNLDGNQGVLHRLLDEAEEQECREAMLAYFFMWRYPREGGWTASDLDDYIEIDLERKANIKVDFEIGDALDKVKRLKIVQELPGGRLRAQPIDKALEMLDYTWDNYFKYNNPDPETPPV